MDNYSNNYYNKYSDEYIDNIFTNQPDRLIKLSLKNYLYKTSFQNY